MVFWTVPPRLMFVTSKDAGPCGGGRDEGITVHACRDPVVTQGILNMSFLETGVVTVSWRRCSQLALLQPRAHFEITVIKVGIAVSGQGKGKDTASVLALPMELANALLRAIRSIRLHKGVVVCAHPT